MPITSHYTTFWSSVKLIVCESCGYYDLINSVAVFGRPMKGVAENAAQNTAQISSDSELDGNQITLVQTFITDINEYLLGQLRQWKSLLSGIFLDEFISLNNEIESKKKQLRSSKNEINRLKENSGLLEKIAEEIASNSHTSYASGDSSLAGQHLSSKVDELFGQVIWQFLERKFR